mmetsp:Transcript_25994/g.58312  ORF Transcript_25994/g.58312 Transcript_25994/m.58312 type:complete len:105 (-) Transcript_25994:187-501(-)
MVRGILAPSVLDRPVCGRRERRKVGGELLHHHVHKRLSSGTSPTASEKTLPPDFLYLDLSNRSSNRDEKKTLQPRRQKTGGNDGACKPVMSRRGLDGELDEYPI